MDKPTADKSQDETGEPEAGWSIRFVGRRREMARLRKVLEADGGSPRSAIVLGEAGVGKTQLVGEVLASMRAKGVQVLCGHCYQMHETGPYFPFFQALSQIGLRESLAHLPGNLARDALDRACANELNAELRSHRGAFLRALSDVILGHLASAEAVLCIEDIQWADPGSLLLLNDLLDIGSPALPIVCTARLDERMPLDARHLLRRIEEKSRRIVLQGLTLRETRELLADIANPARITSEEIRSLHTLTNGNPLFIREMFTHLADTGLLERHSLPEAAQRASVPDGLAHVIDFRLRSLRPRVRRTLGSCSVLGMEFASDLIAEVMAGDEGAVRSDLQYATTEGILNRTDAVDISRYRFAHPMFAKSVYDSLPQAQRRSLHHSVAEAAERNDHGLSLGELARHFALGFSQKASAKATKVCRLAAEDAERVLAYESAARYWELAIRCTGTRSKRARALLFRRLGLALWAAGKWEQTVEAWVRCVTLFESLKDRPRVAEMSLWLAEVLRWRNEFAETRNWADRALRQPLPPTQRARALALRASVVVRDVHQHAAEVLRDAEELYDTSGRDPLVAFWLSLSFSTNGNWRRARSLAKQGFGEAQRRRASRAGALLAGSLVNLSLCDLDLDSARTYASAVQNAADPHDPPTLIRSLVSRAFLLGYAGKWRKVATLSEEWMAQVRLASPYQVATAGLIWAEAKSALGDGRAAQREMLRVLPMKETQPVVAIHLARVLLQLGRSGEAEQLVRRFGRLVMDMPYSAAGRAVLAEVASHLRVPDLQTQCYEALSVERRPMVMTYAPISVQRVLGCLASSLGLWETAIAHFHTALQQLDDGRARWELALAHLDYAQLQRLRRSRGYRARAAALELRAEDILRELKIQEVPLHGVGERFADGNRFCLTGREVEVLGLVAAGKRNQEVAESLTLSLRTVERHLENIFSKMGSSNRTEAVILGVQEGLVGPAASAASGAASGGHP